MKVNHLCVGHILGYTWIRFDANIDKYCIANNTFADCSNCLIIHCTCLKSALMCE